MLTLLFSILRPVLPSIVEGTKSYYFLRRLLTTPHLPSHLRQNIQRQDDCPTIHLLIPPPLPLVGSEIVNLLKPHVGVEFLPILRTARIPLDHPTSLEQAALWSENYWPCTFNPASQPLQKAPPMHVLRRVQAELDKQAFLESCFDLANLAAAEAVQSVIGRKVAAVVVDPVKEEIIAVAGDGRWFGRSNHAMRGEIYSRASDEGRPEHHALMRVIAMIADKDERQETGENIRSQKMATKQDNDLGGRAITPIEKLYAATNADMWTHHDRTLNFLKPQSIKRADAYLCNELDIYLTHEPCVACAMAMVHSRFRACIFQRRMARTGALCAEKDYAGLGYGLFWRKELNWRALTFQYLPSNLALGKDKENVGHESDRLAETTFHA